MEQRRRWQAAYQGGPQERSEVMAMHGGVPLPSTQPKYQPCPSCHKKGFYSYRLGEWMVERCRFCGFSESKKAVR
jgi:hypothetical protein